ncbi:hypothetical protein [Neorhizobium sp. JUb45]|uniref:hypothetical protein n=1 Tax=Neorhizobium sp. JUb45 TaxID=2485113 RepID=UPI00140521C2|nr:hypothetical protein [Neorhizobium sp. JUb45]
MIGSTRATAQGHQALERITDRYPFKLSVRLLGVALSSQANDQGQDGDEDQSQLDFGM